MKKFINNPENLTPELLEGFAEAHKDLVVLGEERMVINKKLDSASLVSSNTMSQETSTSPVDLLKTLYALVFES